MLAASSEGEYSLRKNILLRKGVRFSRPNIFVTAAEKTYKFGIVKLFFGELLQRSLPLSERDVAQTNQSNKVICRCVTSYIPSTKLQNQHQPTDDVIWHQTLYRAALTTKRSTSQTAKTWVRLQSQMGTPERMEYECRLLVESNKIV